MIEPFKTYCSKRMLVLILLGFSSGLPVPLIMQTLQAWLTADGIDIKTIGLFGLVGMPYVLKCLWAPVFDRFALPFLGLRRGWLILSQVCLAISLTLIANLQPAANPIHFALMACLIGFFSASQDIIIDAYRSETLNEQEAGQGVAAYVTGARCSSLIAGGIALVFSDYFGFKLTYLLMASLMVLGFIATLWGEEPYRTHGRPDTLMESVVLPLKEFFAREKAILLIFIILMYKLGDAFAGALTNAFLLGELDFSLTQIGAVKKTVEVISTLLGVFIGGLWMRRLGLYRALLDFGILQAVSNLSFMVLAMVGHQFTLMIVAVFLENLCAGLGTCAFVALLTALCHKRYTATQFALLSALAMVARTLAAPASGALVASMGWTMFYFSTFIISIPGLLLLYICAERPWFTRVEAT